MNSSKFNYIKIVVFFSIILQIPLVSFQQSLTDQKNKSDKIISFIETKYGLDDLLVNGHLYRPLHDRANGSPYFLGDKSWKSGNIFIKGRVFTNQKILYNIQSDEIIINIAYPDGDIKNIVLDSKFTDSILIENHFFINISPYTGNNEKGLYEQVYNGTIKGLIKHRSHYKKVITRETPDGYYEEPITTLFILKDKNLIKISNKKSLFAIYNIHKKQIARFIRNKKIKIKKAPIPDLYNLFKYCDDLSSKSI